MYVDLHGIIKKLSRGKQLIQKERKTIRGG